MRDGKSLALQITVIDFDRFNFPSATRTNLVKLTRARVRRLKTDPDNRMIIDIRVKGERSRVKGVKNSRA